ELTERFRRAKQRWQRTRDTIGTCRHAERLVTGCCERHYRCHHPDQKGNIYEPRLCSSRCPLYRKQDTSCLIRAFHARKTQVGG
ncbi:MAG: hypothetical protein R6X33_16655, partial [Candidatus Brocadiia bacterium]